MCLCDNECFENFAKLRYFVCTWPSPAALPALMPWVPWTLVSVALETHLTLSYCGRAPGPAPEGQDSEGQQGHSQMPPPPRRQIPNPEPRQTATRWQDHRCPQRTSTAAGAPEGMDNALQCGLTVF